MDPATALVKALKVKATAYQIHVNLKHLHSLYTCLQVTNTEGPHYVILRLTCVLVRL
jgi:hypothetical protein